jgi:hypothetical protein
VHNEARSGRPSVITEDMKDRVDADVCKNGQFTADELHGSGRPSVITEDTTFVKTADSLLMSLMKFSHMFRDLSSARLSQFNYDTEKFVSDEFQECSQMNTNSYGLVKWTGGGRLL